MADKIFLEFVDTVPLEGNEQLTFELQRWLTTLADTINSSFQQLQDSINNLAAPQFTTAQITALAAHAPNGALFYDTDTDQLKAKVNGIVVVLV